LYSEIEIVNLALNTLGKASLRDFSLTEDDPASGRISKRVYENIRDRLVSAHDWTFARASVYLKKKAEEHPEGVRYGMPSDCFVPRRLAPRLGKPNRWSVEGRDIIIPFSMISVMGVMPILRYTRYVDKTGLFPPYFVLALSTAIAAGLAMPLTGDKDVKIANEKSAMYLLSDAKLIDSNIGCGDDYQDQDLEYDTFVIADQTGTLFYG